MNILRITKKINFLKFWLILVIIIFFMAIGLVSGYWLQTSSFQETLQNNDRGLEIHQSGYKYISPLLECNTSNFNDRESQALEQELNVIIADQIKNQNVTDVSIYIRDLNNGPWIDINNNERFSPASLLKVPILISYLKLAESNPEILKKKIYIEPIDPKALDQNIPPEKTIKGGREYNTMDLLTHMIDYSDNIAADALFNNTNPQDISQIYTYLNINMPNDGQTENFMTVKDYSSFLRILYNASYLNRDMSELALKIMSDTSFKKGLVMGLPTGVTVAHKFGERDIAGIKQLHDCGIVYIPKNNYLICVMTRGQEFPQLEKVIQLISATAYKYFSKFQD